MQKGSAKSKQLPKEKIQSSEKSQKGINLAKSVRSSVKPSEIDVEQPSAEQTSDTSSTFNSANTENSASRFGIKCAHIASVVFAVGGAYIGTVLFS